MEVKSSHGAAKITVWHIESDNMHSKHWNYGWNWSYVNRELIFFVIRFILNTLCVIIRDVIHGRYKEGKRCSRFLCATCTRKNGQESCTPFWQEKSTILTECVAQLEHTYFNKYRPIQIQLLLCYNQKTPKYLTGFHFPPSHKILMPQHNQWCSWVLQKRRWFCYGKVLWKPLKNPNIGLICEQIASVIQVAHFISASAVAISISVTVTFQLFKNVLDFSFGFQVRSFLRSVITAHQKKSKKTKMLIFLKVNNQSSTSCGS